MNLVNLINSKTTGYVILENVGTESIYFKGARIMPGDRFQVQQCDIAEAENVLAFSEVVQIME